MFLTFKKICILTFITSVVPSTIDTAWLQRCTFVSGLSVSVSNCQCVCSIANNRP